MSIPYALILFRLLMAPTVLYLAWSVPDHAKGWIIACMYLGLISDILDGIIARRQNISTEKMRRLDSQTDMLFWLAIGFATWHMYPQLISDNAVPIWSILLMELSVYLISFIKFKRETCTHAFLSKLWGVSLLIAFTSLIGFNHAGIPFYSAIILGLVSHLDRILITLILPAWAHDVPSAYHAWLIRKKKTFKRNSLLNG